PLRQPGRTPVQFRRARRGALHTRAREQGARGHAGRAGRDDHGAGAPRSRRGRARRLGSRAGPRSHLIPRGPPRYRAGMTSYETIEFERDDSVGWLRLARPERLNSFTVAMWHEMRALGQELRDDPDL